MSGLKQKNGGSFGGAEGDCGLFAPWTHVHFGTFQFLIDYPTMFNKIDCGVLTVPVGVQDECEVTWGELE